MIRPVGVDHLQLGKVRRALFRVFKIILHKEQILHRHGKAHLPVVFAHSLRVHFNKILQLRNVRRPLQLQL